MSGTNLGHTQGPAWPPAFSTGLVKALRDNGIHAPQDLALLQDVQLMQLLSIGVLGARDILFQVYQFLQPKPTTALALLNEYRSDKERMRTPLDSLTEALGGRGFGPMVYEVAGPAGAGKSQFALSCAATLLSAPSRLAGREQREASYHYVAIIDTEGAFSAPRLKQLVSGKVDASLGIDPQAAQAAHASAKQGARAPHLSMGGEGLHGPSPHLSTAATAASSTLYGDDDHVAGRPVNGHTIVTPAHVIPLSIDSNLLARRQRLISGALSRCIVFRCSTVSSVADTVDRLHDAIEVAIEEEEEGDTDEDGPEDTLDGAQGGSSNGMQVDVVSPAASAAAAPQWRPSRKRLVRCRLGMVIIDSVAAAARNEFDASADAAAAAGPVSPEQSSVAGARPPPSNNTSASLGLGRSYTSPPAAAALVSAAAAAPTVSFARRTEALTRLASLLKSKVCDRLGAPVIVTNQITKGLPQGALDAMTSLVRASRQAAASAPQVKGRTPIPAAMMAPPALAAPSNALYDEGAAGSRAASSTSTSSSASFAAWAATFLDQQLVPALGPTWLHAVSMRFLVASSAAATTAGSAAGGMVNAQTPAGIGIGGGVTFTNRGALTIVKSSTAPRLTLPYVITGALGVVDDESSTATRAH